MFGVVPKTLWQRLYPADDNNRCTWAMRLLLVETEGRLILIDTGMGDKQDEKFRNIYEPGGPTLQESLRAKGLDVGDITDVFLTHLHFDHVGGAINRDASGKLVPAFPKATYWSHKDHWHWATNPNPRERASFLPENILPIQESGQLKLLEGTGRFNFMPGFDVMTVNGHTEAMMLPMLQHKGHTVVYAADLMPSTHHIPTPWVMAYDVRPLVTMAEKAPFVQEAAEQNWLFFFEHDIQTECCTLQTTDRGVKAGELMRLDEV